MFRLFGIPIRVSPLFFLTAVVLGQMVGAEGEQWLERLLLWVAIMFAGILMHELGHAFMGRAFGLVPNINLYALGGVTWWREGRPLTPGRSILVSLAGPMVGIITGVVALGAMWSVPIAKGGIEHFALRSLVFVNLGWGVLNLIPMLPLDGGNIMASFFELFAKKSGRQFARYVSIAIAVGLMAYMAATKDVFGILLVAFLAWNNIQGLRAQKQMDAIGPYRPLLQQAYRALAEGDSLGVLGPAQQLAGADSPPVQVEGQLLLAWGRLLRGDVLGARSAADAVATAAADDDALQGAFLLADGDVEGALRHLQRVGDDPVAQARLAAAFVGTDRYDVAMRFFGDVPPGARRHPATLERLARAAEAANRPGEAARLRDILAKLG